MTAVVLERETNNYWNLIKDVSAEIKLALISRLSSSLLYEMPTKAQSASSADMLINDILDNAPKDVPLTDEDILQEIKAVRHVV